MDVCASPKVWEMVMADGGGERGPLLESDRMTRVGFTIINGH